MIKVGGSENVTPYTRIEAFPKPEGGTYDEIDFDEKAAIPEYIPFLVEVTSYVPNVLLRFRAFDQSTLQRTLEYEVALGNLDEVWAHAPSTLLTLDPAKDDQSCALLFLTETYMNKPREAVNGSSVPVANPISLPAARPTVFMGCFKFPCSAGDGRLARHLAQARAEVKRLTVVNAKLTIENADLSAENTELKADLVLRLAQIQALQSAT